MDSMPNDINKFLVSLTPRVLLIPSFSTETGPVIDFTLVWSPAQHILVSSSFHPSSPHIVNKPLLFGNSFHRQHPAPLDNERWPLRDGIPAERACDAREGYQKDAGSPRACYGCWGRWTDLCCQCVYNDQNYYLRFWLQRMPINPTLSKALWFMR